MDTRKRNRLADYDYSQPGAYFITVCTKDRKCLLSTIVGADAYIGPQVRLTGIGQVVRRHLETIPGIGPYVIMPNHVHMIIQIPEQETGDGPMWASAPTVGSLVRSWKILVTKALGQSIWQRSYYDHVIRDQRDYTEIGEYILGNPGKWAEDRYYSTN